MRIQWKDAAGNKHDVHPDDVSHSVELDEHRVECAFDSAGAVVDAVVLKPDTGETAFQLLSLEVDLDRPDGVVKLRRVATGSEDLGRIAFDDLRYLQVGGFTYFICESDEARLTLKLGAHDAGPEDYYRVRVRSLRLDETWVASFRTHFLEQLKDAERRAGDVERLRDELSAAKARAGDLEHRIRVLESSRVWQAAERFRRLFYGRALERFPGLRDRLLNLSRRRVRRSFADEPGRDLGALATNRIRRDARDEAYQALIDHWERVRPDDEAVTRRIAAFKVKPRISVVMPVHDTPAEWLRQAVDSVLVQRYDNFELVICDDASTRAETLETLEGLTDPRIRTVRSEENLHISGATNRALQLAEGDYVAFLDHDDVLDKDALFHVVEAINEMDPDVLYSDEDYIDAEGRFYRPNFKPDFSPDLLLSHNYVTHLMVVRRSVLEAAGPLDPEYDGAQDYDLILRLSELAGSIAHIPRVLYHWRQSPGSSSLEVSSKPYVQERTRKALAAAMARRGVEADILNANLPHFFYTRRRLLDTPSVSVIVPFRDEPALLERCFNSVLKRTTWNEFELIGVNNESASPITYELMEAYRANPRVRFIDYDQPFNFSGIVNLGAREARGEYLVLLNNDVEIITWQWLEEMLRQAVNDSTGAVGGKLFYPDNTVQHAGIVVGIDGYAGHAHKRFECHAQGYGNRLQLVQNVAAVTGAFMMVRKSVFEAVGGFDENAFPVACNDVDFCLRLIDAGYWNVFTPHAQAYHVESASRGFEVTEEKRKRYDKEKTLFRERHAAFLEFGDPFYNPNLSLDNESFMVRIPRGSEFVE